LLSLFSLQNCIGSLSRKPIWHDVYLGFRFLLLKLAMYL
jgi:hypothetical protein